MKKTSELKYGDIVHKMNEQTGKMETFEAVRPEAICAVCGNPYGGQCLPLISAWIMVHPECKNTDAYREQRFVAPSVIFAGTPVLKKIDVTE